MENIATIRLTRSDFLDNSCIKIALENVPSIDLRFKNIKERLESSGDWVVEATYDFIGGENVRWRYSKDKILKGFYVYKTEQRKKLDASEGSFCAWSEAYIL